MKLYLKHEKTDETLYFEYEKDGKFEQLIEDINDGKIDSEDYDYILGYCEAETSELDQKLFDGFGISLEDLEEFYDFINDYDEEEKLKIVMYIDYTYPIHNIKTFDFKIAIDTIQYFQAETLLELAEILYENGFYEEVPDWLMYKMEKIYEAIEELIENYWNEIEIDNVTYFYQTINL